MESLKDAMVFVETEEEVFLGELISVNLKDGTVTLEVDGEDGDETHTVPMESSVFIRVILEYKAEFATPHGEEREVDAYIYDYDFLRSNHTGAEYEILKTDDNEYSLYALQEDNKRGKLTYTFTKHEFKEAMEKKQFHLYNNRYELMVDAEDETEEESFTAFNIKVVRKTDSDGYLHYYYAGNDVERQMVDLIEVVFIGHHLMENDTYKRVELPYDEFVEMMVSGALVDVSEGEFQNYAMGVMMGNEPKNPKDSVVEFKKCNSMCDCVTQKDCDDLSAPTASSDEDETETASDEDANADDRTESEPKDACHICEKNFDDCACELWELF